MPTDWNSVDQIPPALAAILAASGPVNVDLSDVVPDEPATGNGLRPKVREEVRS
jgi:hypothetical protein